MKAIHKGSESDSVITKWLVLVKIYGNNPKKLLKTIREKREINIRVSLELLFPNNVLNSKCRVEVSLCHIRVNREGIAQYSIGTKRIPKKVDNQFNGRFIILDVGSKTENKLVIIFNLLCS